MNLPLVSVIVPVHNAEQFLSAAIKSVLTQTYRAIELIVVDDHSDDRSIDLIRTFRDERIHLISNSGRGASNAMNTGWVEARGDVIAFCDADDIYPVDRIRQQVEWLESNPEYGGVCGAFSTIDGAGKLITLMQRDDTALDITSELARGVVRTSLCTYAIRASLAKKVGGFRDFFESGYDIDFQLRTGEAGKIFYVPENWYFYRIHSSSITHTQSSLIREFFAEVAHTMQRQRRISGQDDLQRGFPPSKPNDAGSIPHSSNEHIQGLLVGRAWQEFVAGQRLQALGTAIRAVAAHPFKIEVWKSMAVLIYRSMRDSFDTR